MDTKSYINWVNFYMELADKLIPFKNNRKKLIEKIKNIYTSINMRLPKLEADNNLIDIDPFTIFGLFNKGISNANRTTILKGFSQEFSVVSSVPNSFEGIPVVNNMSATFYYFIGDRQENDIENLWQMFILALEYANTHSESSKKAFIEAYDMVSLQKGVKWNITIALYWIRPYEYMNLDSRNRWYISNPENMPADYIDSVDSFGAVPSGEEYLNIVDKTRAVLEKGDYSYKNFPELSCIAWIVSEQVNEENRNINSIDKISWFPMNYSPGFTAEEWCELLSDTEICYLDNLKALKRLLDFGGQATCAQLAQKYGGSANFYNSGLSYLAMRIYKKTNCSLLIENNDNAKWWPILFLGRHVVPSIDGHIKGMYIWKLRDELEQALKMLDLSKVPLYENEIEFSVSNKEVYNRESFLKDVYMSKDNYNILSNLLINKKNIIIQGAPGVGKTFAAKKLAYSMMGVKDPNRVMMVQFHQSYSYEDFIMGFRPSSTGFELRKGPFYEFCKKAELDIKNNYYFIIDEINRGNLSKIFGELFMLIENDKRGLALQLIYSDKDEKFSVPENIYIIGMMNTADRSLAMLDYALRRRFAFFEFSPAFDTDGFRQYRHKKNNKKFDNLIATIEQLNVTIQNDANLGRGFQIGHSYFCTDRTIDDMWLNSVITYEIVPLLNEYWFDEPSKVRDWERTLREAIR